MKKNKKFLLVLLIMLFVPIVVFAAPEDGIDQVDGVPATSLTEATQADANPVAADEAPVTNDANPVTADAAPVTNDANPVTADGLLSTDDNASVANDAITTTDDTQVFDTYPNDNLDTTTNTITTETTNYNVTTGATIENNKSEDNAILYIGILAGIVIISIAAVVVMYKKSEQA